MEYWLLAIVALALIPIMRLFMARSCSGARISGRAPPGTDPMTLRVQGSSGPHGIIITIEGGEASVIPPSAINSRAVRVPSGGLFRSEDLPAMAADFEGTEPPYEWNVTLRARVFVNPGGTTLRPGSQEVEGGYSFVWAGNGLRNVQLTVGAFDTSVLGPAGAPALPVWQLQVTGIG